jgi:hypothetical protein
MCWSWTHSNKPATSDLNCERVLHSSIVNPFTVYKYPVMKRRFCVLSGGWVRSCSSRLDVADISVTWCYLWRKNSTPYVETMSVHPSVCPYVAYCKCAPISADSVSAVYHNHQKIWKLKKQMVHKFQNAHQVRMGHNMVKSSSPNAPSTWLIFFWPSTYARTSEYLAFIRTRERESTL